MADTAVKFTEEEMKSIQEIQQTYNTVSNTFGQVSVNRIRVEAQLAELDAAEDRLKSDLANNQTREREFVDVINKKYGDGNLDIATGVFTPRPTEETPDKTL